MSEDAHFSGNSPYHHELDSSGTRCDDDCAACIWAIRELAIKRTSDYVLGQLRNAALAELDTMCTCEGSTLCIMCQAELNANTAWLERHVTFAPEPNTNSIEEKRQ